MASRRDALQKLDKKLKDLAQRVPEGAELYSILFSLADPGLFGGASPGLGGLLPTLSYPAMSDRASAIIAAAYLDHGLQKAITSHLKRDIQESEIKELFGDRGPLGTMSARTIACQALGIIDAVRREDLDTLRTIRNSFAHSMSPLTFSDEAVERLCEALTSPRDWGITPAPKTPKDKFVASVAMLFYHLETYYPQKRAMALAAALMKPSPDKPK